MVPTDAESDRKPARGSERILSIFISYSRSDGAFARDVASRLREAGCTVWQDASGLYGGQAWSRGIDQAIRSCDVLLIVLSPDSCASEWVQKETLLAMKLRKPIVPVLFREAEIPVQLVDLQFVDFRGNRAETISISMARAMPGPASISPGITSY